MKKRDLCLPVRVDISAQNISVSHVSWVTWQCIGFFQCGKKIREMMIHFYENLCEIGNNISDGRLPYDICALSNNLKVAAWKRSAEFQGCAIDDRWRGWLVSQISYKNRINSINTTEGDQICIPVNPLLLVRRHWSEQYPVALSTIMSNGHWPWLSKNILQIFRRKKKTFINSVLS